MVQKYTDRELLEFAAKAAGRHIAWWEGATPYFRPDDLPSGVPWRPLTDDADALRLAVKLGLHVDIADSSLSVYFWIDELCDSADEDFNDDACAATRRAIVRAAAEIGRSMP